LHKSTIAAFEKGFNSMRVKFAVNLGSRAAAQFEELDYTKCTAGATVDVSDEAGEYLVGLGCACKVETPAAAKAAAKAEPKSEVAPEPKK
jgi:hypothetical protein